MQSIFFHFCQALGLEGLEQEENRGIVRAGLVMALVALLLRIGFWCYTSRYWEDALITCLHSENCVNGLGLTHFRPGEAPLHGFTSPLSVLVPLLGDLMHVGFGIEFLKLVSIPAAALTVLYLLAIGIHPSVRLPGPLTVLLMGYAAFEHHQILFGMAGMETQLAVCILVMSIYYLIAGKPIALGVSLGLCMLARPDYAFWTLIVGGYLLVRQPRVLPKVVGVALALYLPWILFTTWYYGSPVPHTIIAKGLGYPKWWDTPEGITWFTVKRHTWVTLSENLVVLLSPCFAGHGASLVKFFFRGSESPVANLMFSFAVLGTLTVFVRRQWALVPVVLFAVIYSVYYVYLVPIIFHWYKMPYLVVLLLVSVRGIQAATAWIPAGRPRLAVLSVFTVAYLGLFLAVLPKTFYAERMIQTHIEDDVRKQAGLYLRDHMKADEAVGCEPLGYMGYYSRGNVYDWPGLDSRTVTEWSKAHPNERSLEAMLKGLRPEYLYLRENDLRKDFKDTRWIEEDYELVRTFNLDPEAAKRIPWVNRNVDTAFRLYKKKHPNGEPSAAHAVKAETG